MKCLICLILVSAIVLAGDTWFRTYGDDLLEQGFFTFPMDDGGYLMCGIFVIDTSYSIISDEHPGGGDCELIRTTEDGDIIWSEDYFSGPWLDLAPAGVETADGGLVLAGVTTTMENGMDFWLFRVDSQGEVVWERTFGDEWDQFAYDVTETSDGGFFLVGWAQAQDDLNQSWMCVVRTDEEGNEVFSTYFQEPDYGKAEAVVETDQGFLVGGYFERPQAVPFLCLIDNDGSPVWCETYRRGSEDCYVIDIAQLDDGNIVMTGYTTQATGDLDIWIAEADPDGEIVWDYSYGGTGEEMSFEVIPCRGGCVAVGSTTSMGAGNKDIWLLCLDRNGEVVWEETHGGPGNESAEGIVLLDDGGYLVTGCSSSWSGGEMDYYLLRVDSRGRLEE